MRLRSWIWYDQRVYSGKSCLWDPLFPVIRVSEKKKHLWDPFFSVIRVSEKKKCSWDPFPMVFHVKYDGEQGKSGLERIFLPYRPVWKRCRYQNPYGKPDQAQKTKGKMNWFHQNVCEIRVNLEQWILPRNRLWNENKSNLENYKENQIVPGNRLWSQISVKSQDAKRNRSENSRKHKTIENGTGRSGETTNKQKSLEEE